MRACASCSRFSRLLSCHPRGPSSQDTYLPTHPRSAKRYKDATYELPGPASTENGAESVKQTAAKIVAYFQANNYKIKEAGETIT